jgi:hypothetical protein
MDPAMHYQAKHEHDWCAWIIVLFVLWFSLFATSRVYGRFDEGLGMYPKLSTDSNLQTFLQETAHNSIMNTSFAHALTVLV